MLRFLLLAVELACVATMTLRGVGAPAAASSSSTAAKKPSAAKKPFVDERGERGHFYYADKCEDCFYKGAQCGCQPAMEYMACLTKHCTGANETAFAEKCTALGSKCAQDIDIDCRSHNTVCHSKHHQLPAGGVGLKVEVVEDEALCGPFGKCIGQLRMKATIINGPKSTDDAVEGAAPAPSAPAAASPAPASASPAAADAPQVWLECGLPNKEKADIDSKEDWNICQAEADGAEADCDLPLPDNWIKASEKLNAYCLLKESEEGKRLTQPSWHAISNVHEKPKEEAPEAKEVKKDAKKTKKAKEPKEKKEAKDEKKAKQPKEEKDEKKEKDEKDDKKEVKEAKEPKKAKGEQKAEKESGDDIGKLPWMVDKEERQADRKEAKAKEPKESKKPEKDEKKKAAKEESNEPHASGLPWMAGKGNDKVAPPGADALK